MSYSFKKLNKSSSATTTVNNVSFYKLSEQQPTPSVDNFIKFSSPNSFSVQTQNQSRQWNGTMQYSDNNGQNWLTFLGGTVNSGYDSQTSTYVLLFRGVGNTHFKSDNTLVGSFKFVSGSDITVSGNLESLLDYEVVAGGNHPSIDDYCFAYLFSGNPIIDASNLVLSDSIAQYCYANMFRSCTSLIYSVKNLKAATQSACYRAMFYGCSNMITIPSINREVSLAANSCREMFNGCSKIKLSTTQDSEYTNEYIIPLISASTAINNMFTSTGGSFTGTPASNTTYYTSNQVV